LAAQQRIDGDNGW